MHRRTAPACCRKTQTSPRRCALRWPAKKKKAFGPAQGKKKNEGEGCPARNWQTAKRKKARTRKGRTLRAWTCWPKKRNRVGEKKGESPATPEPYAEARKKIKKKGITIVWLLSKKGKGRGTTTGERPEIGRGCSPANARRKTTQFNWPGKKRADRRYHGGQGKKGTLHRKEHDGEKILTRVLGEKRPQGPWGSQRELRRGHRGGGRKTREQGGRT